jgi:F-type H+-transporting ATPase subunit a
MPHISLRAEVLTTFFGLPITNSLVMSWVTMGILIILSLIATKSMKKIPGNAQLIAETIIGSLYDFFSQVTGPHIKSFFPLLATIFLFVMSANWLGLLPGVGTIGIKETEKSITVSQNKPEVDSSEPLNITHSENPSDQVEQAEQATPNDVSTKTSTNQKPSTSTEGHALVPILRPATADINMTVGLAIIAVLSIQYFGFALSGIHYASRFIDTRGPINAFVGILELFSEFAKIISFAFRLFGNVFAGEVLLSVMAFLMPLIVPMPFILMELFVGFIQALVFSMLTAVFLNVAVSHGEHAAHEAHEAHAAREKQLLTH